MSDLPKPKSIYIEAKMNAFGIHQGISMASTFGQAYDIPEDWTDAQVEAFMFARKERLDLLCATAERAKGNITSEFYGFIKESLKNAYDRILKRKPADSSAA